MNKKKLLIYIFIISCILFIIIIYKNINYDELLSLLHPTNQLPLLENYNTIPNILCQIYMFYTNPIPQYIFDALNQYASNYKYILFNDKNAIQFLERYFDHRVVQCFHNLKLGAHKADLLRYCFLYVYGGIYIDIKTILIKPLDEIFINKTAFYTCISIKDSISNGIIASKPRNYIFLKLINNIININPDYPESDGLVFCNFLNDTILNDLLSCRKKYGLNIGRTQNYYLFCEQCHNILSSNCSKLDRYGYCCSILDKEKKIFIGRDPTFPW